MSAETVRNTAAAVSVRVPGDKSITHRALLLSVLATGQSRVRGALVAEDTRSTAACLRALGAAVPELDANEIVIDGIGPDGLREPASPLDCGNSGTSARLLIGVLAGRPFRTVLTGDASLRSRPMRRVTAPLAAAGASFVELESPDRLPIAVTGGALRPIDHASPVASAQIKSALLLAGLSAATSVHVREPARSRDHTERMLAAMGASIRTGSADDGAWVRYEPGGRLGPLELDVPGDFSSAAFFLALGLLGTRPVRVEHVGLNPTRTGFLDLARRMGGKLDVHVKTEQGGEPTGDVVAWPSELHGEDFDVADVAGAIDEIPLLAVLAARAAGETRITGAGELRVKESDRIAAVVTNLRELGATAEELPDGLVVQGSDAPLAGNVRTHDDHRIAMAFGVLGALPANEIVIDRPAVAAVSFPSFWAALREAAGSAHE